MSELYDLTTDPRELVNLWGKPSVAVVQQRMLDGLLKWFQETTVVTPLAVDNVGYPDNHTSPDEREEFWWETFNPMLHPILQTMTVDGHFLDAH